MALICKNLEQISSRTVGYKLWSPNCCHQVRGKKKLTLRSPQFPVYEKKLLLAACEPIMKRVSDYPTSITCPNLKSDENFEPHPYVKILADEFKSNLDKSTLTIFYHVNSIDDLTYKENKNLIMRLGFKVEIYGNDVAELALKSTRYRPLLKFYSRSVKTAVAFGDNVSISKVNNLLKLERSAPFMILMFGIYENQVLRKNELKELANLPGLPILHAQLVHTLNSFASSLSSTLDYHGKQLSLSLETYSKSKSDKS
ncbi:39S ribosomal protein L10, mitochondrial-like [Panonychus citri]|uniref:39S ribosomal protein L10, mitochondrial-like n=1 Tax=Panonychus citri TaxID=50023 RepID=UPI002307D373|nr:39S ribosomal protein L10, mitochondrial-like [Panonychus citri]